MMRKSNKFKSIFVFILALIVLGFGLTLLIGTIDFKESDENHSINGESQSISERQPTQAIGE